MATKYLYPKSSDENVNVTYNGATLHESIDDPYDNYDDGTTQAVLKNAATHYYTCAFTTMSPASEISDVLHEVRGHITNVGRQNMTCHLVDTASEGSRSFYELDITFNTQTTFTTLTANSATDPIATAAWTYQNLNTYFVHARSAAETTYDGLVTGQNLQVTFVPESGGMLVWFSWLPPLFAIANQLGQALNAEPLFFSWLKQYFLAQGLKTVVTPPEHPTGSKYQEEREWVLNKLIYKPKYAFI